MTYSLDMPTEYANSSSKTHLYFILLKKKQQQQQKNISWNTGL